MFAFAATRPRRKPSLTPMIDVVFLLLVFFMLAARFGHDMALPMTLVSSGDTAYEGPPRLVDVTPEGTRLNGIDQDPNALAAALRPLMTSPDDIVLIRARNKADLQRLVEVIEFLRQSGVPNLVLVE